MHHTQGKQQSLAPNFKFELPFTIFIAGVAQESSQSHKKKQYYIMARALACSALRVLGSLQYNL